MTQNRTAGEPREAFDPPVPDNGTAPNGSDGALGNGTVGGRTGDLPNGTRIDVGNGRVGVVEEGPVWLAKLLYSPPEWLAWTVRGLTAIGVLVVLYLAWRVGRDLDEAERVELLEEYGQLTLIVGSIAVAALVLARHADLPYVVDVLGGTSLGFAASQAILRGLPRVLPGESSA